METVKKVWQYVSRLLDVVFPVGLVLGSAGAMIYMFAIGAFAWEFFLTFAATLYLGVRNFLNEVLKS